MNDHTHLIDDFRRSCRAFIQAEAVPHQKVWEQQGFVDRGFWLKAGDAGLLGLGIPPDFGGRGLHDYRYSAVVAEELVKADVSAPGIISHNDLTASYIQTLGTDSQKRRWLPGLRSGEIIGAIAVTEPTGGSNSADLKTTAVSDGDNFVVDGTKAYITNGYNADLIVTAVKTSDSHKGGGLSLLAIERDTPGFTRGRIHKKLGWHASDTADLYFDSCAIPKQNLLGRINLGNMHFLTAMPRERLSISVVAVASAEAVLAATLRYARERTAFGNAVGTFQYNRFDLARMHTEIALARIYIEDSISRYNLGELNTVSAASLKLWTSELQFKVADRCLQLFGGSGYMAESFIARQWTNSRVQTIYGGTSEIMMEIISRSLSI